MSLKIPTQQILNKLYTPWDAVYSNELENEDTIVMLLCILYHNNKITTQQLAIYLHRHSSINKNKDEIVLDRWLNTYKSPISGLWYNDVTYLTALYGDYQDAVCVDLDISVEQYLKYLNIGFNRNRNWCLNYMANNWIKPYFYYLDKLKWFGFEYMTFEEADDYHNLGSGYCCSDCDGCLRQYKESRYKDRYAPDMDDIKEYIINELRQYAKPHWNEPF